MKHEKEFHFEYQIPEFRGRKLVSITQQILATLLPIAVIAWFLRNGASLP